MTAQLLPDLFGEMPAMPAEAKEDTAITIAKVEEYKPSDAVVSAPKLTLDEKMEAAIEVMAQLLRDQKVLNLSCSFGKDSSVLLALAVQAIMRVQAEGIDYFPVHVIHANTGLENPVVEEYSLSEIRKVKAFVAQKGLKLEMLVEFPSMSNDYLVSVIGGRITFSLPGMDKKCQQMMKAAPIKKVKSRLKNKLKAMNGGQAMPADRQIALVGLRSDESVNRSTQMAARGDNAHTPTYHFGNKEWFLSPIADFDEMDVFGVIGKVRNGQMENYSDFEQLIQVYRDAESGECLVTQYMTGRSKAKTNCSARFGCFVCSATKDDKSMENMIAKDDGEYDHLKPLNDIRNWIVANHWNPDMRNWMGRSVAEDGTIALSPLTYSPDMCLSILRFYLTAQADEYERLHVCRMAIADFAASGLSNFSVDELSEGYDPRFQVLYPNQILAIDMMWERYGMFEPFRALREYYEIVEKGKRYYPDNTQPVPRKPFPESIRIPFADSYHGIIGSGMEDHSAMVAGVGKQVEKNGQYHTHIPTEDCYSIDLEGSIMFFDYEIEYILEDSHCRRVWATLNNYDMIRIGKGKESTFDQSLRYGEQVRRLGLKASDMNSYESIIKRISERKGLGDTLQPVIDELDAYFDKQSTAEHMKTAQASLF